MNKRFPLLCVAAGLLAAPIASFAQTDEIQVYDAAIADKGKFNLMLHNNFTPDGRKTADFPGGIIPNHDYNGVAEWAYGVTKWFEAGLYMPLYSDSAAGGLSFNGYKFRALFVKPNADDQKFLLGVNFEFSVNQKQWDPRHFSSEIRPIIGWHFKPVDLIINPIMDTSYTGGLKSLDFAPSVRVAYNLPKGWAVSAEEYADFGEFRGFETANNQSHQIWATVNHDSVKGISVETGIGFGITSAADKVTLKLMISRDLN